MNGVLAIVAAGLLGVDAGWQPVDDGQGGFEYILQIEPELLETLKSGQHEIISDIPPQLRGVRRYRIIVGRGVVPRKGTPPPVPQNMAQERQEPVAARAEQPDPNEVPVPVAPPSDLPPAAPPADLPVREPALSVLPSAPTGFDRYPDLEGPAIDPLPRQPASDEPPTVSPSNMAKAQPPIDDPFTTASSNPPQQFSPEPNTQQIVQASGSEEIEPEPVETNKPELPGDVSPGGKERPWVAFSLALLGFFASLGGNLWMGWNMLDTRRRYHQLVRQVEA